MSYITETVLKDIVDIISDVKDIDQFESYLKRIKGNRTLKSVASASSSLTLVFPCLCSNSLSLNALSTINKVNESKAVEMLQLLFASIQMTRSTDARDYLSRFHSNIDDTLTIDNILDNIERVIDLTESVDEKYIQEKLSLGEIEFICKQDFKNIQSGAVDDEYNIDSIDFYRIKESYNNYDIIKEAPQIRIVDPDEIKVKSGIVKIYKDKIDGDTKSMPTINNKDVIKQNDIVGTQIMVTINYIGSSNIAIPTTFLVVVKSKLYILDTNDIINKLVEKTRDKNLFSKIIKLYSGEISFFKDFVFAIDKAKSDALSQSTLNPTSSKMWRILERRSSKSRFHRALNTKNSAMAISTLVISKEEVEHIKRFHNIDLERSSVARMIMESYNLLCLVIADEVNEMASFLYDTGDDEFETVTFAGLEKEVREGPYRKSLQMLIASNK